jgi:hypothetical protein
VMAISFSADGNCSLLLLVSIHRAVHQMFCVVLCLVPGLFYVKYLERRNVLRLFVFFAHAYRGPAGRSLPLREPDDMEHVEHVEHGFFQ